MDFNEFLCNREGSSSLLWSHLIQRLLIQSMCKLNRILTGQRRLVELLVNDSLIAVGISRRHVYERLTEDEANEKGYPS